MSAVSMAPPYPERQGKSRTEENQVNYGEDARVFKHMEE